MSFAAESRQRANYASATPQLTWSVSTVHAYPILCLTKVTNNACAMSPDPKGGLGVKFAGTAVTSSSTFEAGISPAAADAISRVLIGATADTPRDLAY